MSKIILTGDRPTGRLHIGHYVGSLRRRVQLQNTGDFDEIYIMIADAQALTDNFDNPEKVRSNIGEVALDYMAAGLDPEKSTIFIQSMIPELPENEACMRLPGTDGKAKMSKSLGNCIYLADSPADIKTKIMSMFTDPLHIQVSDPGHIEGNTVFTYLDAFCTDEHFERYLPDYKNLDELKEHYKRGGLGDMKIKKFLNNVMQEELEPIRLRREELAKNMDYVYDVLKKGTEKAHQCAAQTMSEVKKAMKIDYFG